VSSRRSNRILSADAASERRNAGPAIRHQKTNVPSSVAVAA
jgi:hypothetical protein